MSATMEGIVQHSLGVTGETPAAWIKMPPCFVFFVGCATCFLNVQGRKFLSGGVGSVVGRATE